MIHYKKYLFWAVEYFQMCFGVKCHKKWQNEGNGENISVSFQREPFWVEINFNWIKRGEMVGGWVHFCSRPLSVVPSLRNISGSFGSKCAENGSCTAFKPHPTVIIFTASNKKQVMLSLQFGGKHFTSSLLGSKYWTSGSSMRQAFILLG